MHAEIHHAAAARYLSRALITGYDIYFSFSGGDILSRLEQDYGALSARPLYCSVDVGSYRPLDVPVRWDLSYLGTYSPDRQPTLERLLIEPARRRPDLRFAVAGPQYPSDIVWPDNVERIEHLPPAEHAAFYSASRFTLNVTRADMIAAGWSPSVRLFEAGACGTPIISDKWQGIETVLTPGSQIILADDSDEVIAALDRSARLIGKAARDAVLAHHSADRRAEKLEADLRGAMARSNRREVA